MEFGSSLVYAAKDSSKVEYEHIPESRYNHVVKAYSAGASGTYDPNDDGEVKMFPHKINNNYVQLMIIKGTRRYLIILMMSYYSCRHACWIFSTQLVRKSIPP